MLLGQTFKNRKLKKNHSKDEYETLNEIKNEQEIDNNELHASGSADCRENDGTETDHAR